MPFATCILLVALCSLAAVPSSAQAPTYTNPVIAGDYADPSAIRVGDTYYAVATSSQWAPAFPLLTSTDLVHWTQVGAVFDDLPDWSAGSYWAPEIAAHDGRYFVYYTARKKDGPLCVAVAVASTPEGPYADRGPLVCQEVGSIDAMPITDEHGRRYLIWKEDGNSRKLPTPLWAQPLSDDGTTLVGERKEILRNEAPWEAHLVEGAFVLPRNGWFYMFYSADACCGRRCNYKLGVARAKALLGPWERNPANPILTGNGDWKCPGHGSIVSTPAGRDYLLYHAYDSQEFEYVGRQGLLDEIVWHADGWPTINGGRGPSRQAPAPAGASAGSHTERVFVDEFTGTRLTPGWQWPWETPPSWRLDARDGGVLELQPGTSRNGAAGGVLARSAFEGNYVATAVIEARALGAGANAGLVAYGDRDNALGVSIGQGHATLWRREKGAQRDLARVARQVSDLVHVRMTASNGSRFQFAVSADGSTWTDIGFEAHGAELPPWDRALRIALTADGDSTARVGFRSLRIESRQMP